MENDRYAFWPRPKRPSIEWPNGARLALWCAPNIEHYPFDRPRSTTGDTDYGNRVGFWRLTEILDKHGLRATVALNSDVCLYEPEIIEAGVARKWEWMGHGKTNAIRLVDIPPNEELAA